MSVRWVFFTVLLCCALASGITVALERWALVDQWQDMSAFSREQKKLGQFHAVIDKVNRTTPLNSSILLFSGLDPALLPYYLHPRKLWQVNSDPETNHYYMDLPTSRYPERDPNSFGADWQLYYFFSNASTGGDLLPVGKREKP